MTVTSVNLDHAFRIREALQQAGIECAIAGGFARDTAYGIEPKDIDILVAAPQGNGKINEALVVLTEMNLPVGYRLLAMYDHHASDRINGVVKLEGEVNVDICFYDAETVSQAIDAFDANLQQWIIRGYRDNFFAQYVGETDINTLTWVRYDMTAERKIRVGEKFLKLVRGEPNPTYEQIVEVISEADQRYLGLI